MAIATVVVASAVEEEAARLMRLSPAVARQQLGDRISRAFLLKADPSRLAESWRALDFNAKLTTELRQAAERRQQQTIWETFH